MYEKFREESLLRKETNLIMQEYELVQGKKNEADDEEKIEHMNKIKDALRGIKKTRKTRKKSSSESKSSKTKSRTKSKSSKSKSRSK